MFDDKSISEVLDAAILVCKDKGFVVTYRLIGNRYYFNCGNKETDILKRHLDLKRWDILARTLQILTSGD